MGDEEEKIFKKKRINSTEEKWEVRNSLDMKYWSMIRKGSTALLQ